MEKEEEAPSRANKQKEEEEVETVFLSRCMPATEGMTWTMVKEIEELYFRLVFSQRVAMKLVDDQGIDS